MPAYEHLNTVQFPAVEPAREDNYPYWQDTGKPMNVLAQRVVPKAKVANFSPKMAWGRNTN